MKFIMNPFGRGSSFDSAEMQALYDALEDLGDGSLLDDENFADDAGVSEDNFVWGTSAGTKPTHKHGDGSLGNAVLSTDMFDTNSYDNVELVVSQQPKTLMIVGYSQNFRVNTSPQTIRVVFATSANRAISFAPGTRPVVLTTLHSPNSNTGSPIVTGSGKYGLITVTDVTSKDFEFRYDATITHATNVWVKVCYCAIGVAPGYYYPYGVT